MTATSTILVIEDQLEGRKILEAILPPDQYSLQFASTGSEGLAQAAALPPDLILLDVMLPDLDGFAVCQRLRADPRLASIPVIMLTALDDRSSRLQGLAAGADDFLSKPVDRLELRARVQALIRLHRTRRLLTARAQFEQVVERAPVGLLILDAQHIVMLANPAIAALLGAEAPAALRGQTFRTRIAPAQREYCAALVDGVLANLVQVTRTESILLRTDGSPLAVELDIGQFVWDEQPAAQIIVRDISERKQAEAQIQRQLAQLAALRTIDLAITANLDLHATLDVLLEQVIAQLRVDAAAVRLVDPASQTLHAATARGLTTGTTQLGASYAERVARERLTLALPDLAAVAASPAAAPLLAAGFGAYYGVPLIAKQQVQGVLELLNRELLAPEAAWLDFLETLAGQAAVAIDNARLLEGLQRANLELRLAYDSTLAGWSRALDLRDKETEGHSQRVTEMTLRLAQAMGLPDEEQVHIRRGALLHDIGKMGVPDAILLKPGPLTDEEWVLMRQHPVYAYELLVPIGYLGAALDIPYCHHEKWDGTGYPRGLAGEAIPLAARIFAVVDVWDAMRSDRPYRRGRAEQEVRAHIRALAGTHFDPQAAAAFLALDGGTSALDRPHPKCSDSC